ncbi:hypothetical protein tb265_31720 [Gemmatimonadetes bacterium T265]|nr:hypothetical protein tb265_31720 [Gemmatimonadetes bacterium T265]
MAAGARGRQQLTALNRDQARGRDAAPSFARSPLRLILSSTSLFEFLVPTDPLSRLRALCLALPEAHEALAWGEPTFRVRNKLFATYASAGSHHGAGRPAVWVKATSTNQALLVEAAPARYFVPPYVGASGWVGVWLDRRPAWRALEGLLRDAYCRTAPKTLVARLAGESPAGRERR